MDFRSILDNSFSAAVGVDAVIYALAAIGLNLQFGYTGLLNFGQVGFAAVALDSATVAGIGVPEAFTCTHS